MGASAIGRVIGLVWAVDLRCFRRLQNLCWVDCRLLLLRFLGGMQGAIGWWMVASGLTGERLMWPAIRQPSGAGLIRFTLVCALARPFRESAFATAPRREQRLFSMSTGLMHFTFLQILIGALVAGIDAGRNYIDWPLMAGGFFPLIHSVLRLWRWLFSKMRFGRSGSPMPGYLLFILAWWYEAVAQIGK